MCYSKLTPLRWNKFPITYEVSDVVLVFDVILRTRALSLNLIPDERVKRHQLLLQLHEAGLDDREIAEFFNLSGIRTPTGKTYYKELVFVTRRKICLRETRKSREEMSVQNIKFFLQTR
jgi:hypothetical protein